MVPDDRFRGSVAPAWGGVLVGLPAARPWRLGALRPGARETQEPSSLGVFDFFAAAPPTPDAAWRSYPCPRGAGRVVGRADGARTTGTLISRYCSSAASVSTCTVAPPGGRSA